MFQPTSVAIIKDVKKMPPMFSAMTEISGKTGEKWGSHKRRRWNVLETGAICGEEGEKTAKENGKWWWEKLGKCIYK